MNRTADSRPAPAIAARVGAFWHCLQQRGMRVLLLVLCGIGVRLPALPGDLIWDDQLLVRDNPLIKSPLLILETFRHHLFLDSFTTHYRPVQNVSYTLDYLLWETNWHGYHLSNVLWHVAGGVLLFLLLEKLLRGLLLQPAAVPADVAAQEKKSGTTSTVAFLIALLWWCTRSTARRWITSPGARIASPLSSAAAPGSFF
jgi:hypothetical protein